MFVACSLGSEDCTDATITYSKTMESAIESVKSTLPSDDHVCDWDYSPYKENRVARCDCKILDSDWFFIDEIFEIPDDTNFITVWWHGYDGVDFVVTPFINFTDAIEDWDKNRKNAIGDEVIANLDFLFNDDNYDFCIDTGNEWECCKIINVREVREI